MLDVDIQWVPGNQYVQFHEMTGEENSNSLAMCEAFVFIGWDEKLNQSACLWCDVTGGGGLSTRAIGHAERDGKNIAFLTRRSDNSLFHIKSADFSGTDKWQWLMDSEENGNLQSFA